MMQPLPYWFLPAAVLPAAGGTNGIPVNTGDVGPPVMLPFGTRREGADTIHSASQVGARRRPSDPPQWYGNFAPHDTMFQRTDPATASVGCSDLQRRVIFLAMSRNPGNGRNQWESWFLASMQPNQVLDCISDVCAAVRRALYAFEPGSAPKGMQIYCVFACHSANDEAVNNDHWFQTRALASAGFGYRDQSIDEFDQQQQALVPPNNIGCYVILDGLPARRNVFAASSDGFIGEL